MNERFPVSYMQKRILKGAAAAMPSDAFRVLYTYPGSGAELVAEAIQNLTERYADLQVRFTRDGGEVAQYHQKSDRERVFMVDAGDGWQTEYDFDAPFGDPFDVPLYAFYVQQDGGDTRVYAKFHAALVDNAGAAVIGEMIHMEIKNRGEGEIPPVTYRYPQIEDAYFQSEDYLRDTAYWRDVFPATKDFPDRAGAGSKAGSRTLEFGEELAAGIVDYCEGQHFKATPFRFVLALVGAYMLRRHNVRNVPILTICAGRRELPDGLKYSAGLYANPIALRLDSNGEEGFSSFFKGVSAKLNVGNAHGRYPFDLLADALGEQGSKPEKLLKVEVTQNAAVSAGFQMEPLPGGLAADIAFRVSGGRGGIRGVTIEYRRDAYSVRDIDFICAGLVALAREVLEDGEKPLRELPVMGEQERFLLLSEYQGERLDYDVGTTFLDGFTSAAREHPDAIAIKDSDEEITYQVLDALTDRMGALLQRRHRVRGKFCAILLPRGNACVAAILGILKAGAAYVVVDENWPRSMVEAVLADCDAAVAITSEALADKCGNYEGKVLYVGELVHEAVAARGGKPGPPAPDENAYAVYLPEREGGVRGAYFTHRALRAMIAWRSREAAQSPQAAECFALPFAGGEAVLGIFPALFYGARLEIIGEDLLLDAPGLVAHIRENGLTDAVLPAVYAQLLVGQGLELQRLFVFDGNLRKLPKCTTVYQLHGVAEFTGAACMGTGSGTFSVGGPVPNARCYIVDRNTALLPVGCVGELCVAGMQLPQGYLNGDEERLVENPFDDRYKKMFRTGDYARWDGLGGIEILGRLDGRVHICGRRIELRAVERAIAVMTGTTEVAATVRGDVVVGYYRASFEVDTQSKLRKLKRVLPRYMLPAALVRVDHLPRNAAGRIDYAALPPISDDRAGGPPQGKQQVQAAEAAGAVLHSGFGVDTPLAGVGMGWLSALRIAAKLEKRTGVRISGGDVLRAGTVKELAIMLDKLEGQQQAVYEKRTYYPLTENGEAIYANCARDAATTAYNLPCEGVFPKSMEVDELRKAFLEAIDAHPHLKTKLQVHEGDVCRLRQDNIPVEIRMWEVAEEEFATVRREFVQPFRLFEGPLYRIELYRTETCLHVLADFHRLVMDESSLALFLHDVERAYSGQRLKAELFSAYELALLEGDARGGTEYAAARGFFEKRIQAVPATELPQYAKQTGLPRQRVYTEAVRSKHINRYVRQSGITAANLFLGAACFALSKLAQSDKIGLSLLSTGRDMGAYQNIVGPLERETPVFVKVDGALAASAYLAKVQRAVFDSGTHKAFPVVHAKEMFGFVPQIAYAFHGVETGGRLGGQSITLERMENCMPMRPLTLAIGEQGGHYTVEVRYDVTALPRATAKAIAVCVAGLADTFARDEHARLADIPLTTKGQAAEIDGFMRGQQEPVAEGLHGIVADIAAARPRQLVLTQGEARLDYAQLEDCANRIAGGLSERGVQAGDVVAVVLAAGGDAACAMVGALRAGCVFTLLNPADPDGYIHRLLEDSGAKFVICEAEGQYTNGVGIQTLLEHGNDPCPAASGKRTDGCCIVYTSGADGPPVGVLHTHGSLLNAVCAFADNELAAALVKRGCVPCADAVDTIEFVVEALLAMANGLELRIGGQADWGITGFYGCVEAPVCNVSMDGRGAGRPQNGVLEQVMDTAGNPLPVGFAGELWVGGPALAAGYWNRPTLEEAAFVERDGLRWFKTGQAAIWKPDGTLEMLGRTDRQLWLNGRLVHPAEIEHAACAIDGIRESRAVLRLLHGRDRLCLYYTAAGEVPPVQLQKNLESALPAHMLPQAYLQVGSIPIDASALPDAVWLEQGAYVAPQGMDEERFCGLFRVILGIDNIGAEDNFFALGGTQRQAEQLAVQAAEAGYQMAAADLLAYPTPRALAVIAGGRMAGDGYDYTAIHAFLRAAPAECVAAKRQLGNFCIAGADLPFGENLLRAYLQTEAGTAYCIGSVAMQHPRVVELGGEPFTQLDTLPVDTFVNCVQDMAFVQSAVAYCKAGGRRLVHISTTAVAGLGGGVLDERTLYTDQVLSGPAREAFLIERMLLETAARENMDVQIMRLGLLMDDATNLVGVAAFEFMLRLRACVMAECMPVEQASAAVCLSPMRETADAVLLLAGSPVRGIFHPVDAYSLRASDILMVLDEHRLCVQPVDEKTFARAYAEVLLEHGDAPIPGGLPRPVRAEHTTQALLREGFKWPLLPQGFAEHFTKTLIADYMCNGEEDRS